MRDRTKAPEARPGSQTITRRAREPGTGRERANLFVRIVDNGNSQARQILRAGILQCVEDSNHACLAVCAARARRTAVRNAEGALLRFAVGKNRVEVRVEHDVELFSVGLIGGEKALAGLGPHINELRVESDRIEVPLHDFRDGRDAFAIGAAAVDVDDFGQILQVAFKHFFLCQMSSR